MPSDFGIGSARVNGGHTHSGYFITHDDRIRRRAGRLGEVLPPSLTVITLADFLAIFHDYAARYPR